MRAGIISLLAAYVLSQFYRAFLAVLSPSLTADLAATPQDLAAASGLWFLAFAVMQLPIGTALDTIGPRRTTASLLAVGAAGAALFASATTIFTIKFAMLLIGVGCAPVLMSSYYIFARIYSPAAFATLAGATIGIGSLGNIASSLPLTAAIGAFGWRETVWALAAITLIVAAATALLIRDPERLPPGPNGSLRDLLRMRSLWPILAMMTVCYAPAAGLRGLWIGPYFTDTFAAPAATIGRISLFMGLAMVAGNFAYGPLDRLFGTRKWVIVFGNLLTLLSLFALTAFPGDKATAIACLIAIGFFGASFGLVIAHGRAFFPPHLMGRGVTLLNLFGIAPIGIFQVATGQIHASVPTAPYQAIFIFFALTTTIGLGLYLFARDRTD